VLECRYYGCTGSHTRRREGANSNPLTSHERSLEWRGLWFLLRVNIWTILNNLPLVRFRQGQTDMVVYHSWRNFNEIIALCSGIILCSHLFTWFCTGSTDFKSTGCVQATSAFRSLWSLSSFKMAASTSH